MQEDLNIEFPFLGREFLTWLLYATSEKGGNFDLGQIGRVGIYFDDALTLMSEEGDAQRDIFVGGAPAVSYELGTALYTGKTVSKARLTVARGDQTWDLTLDAHLDVVALKPPKLELDEDVPPEEAEAARLALVEELMAILDNLVLRFLAWRMDEEAGVEKLRQWIAMRGTEVCHL